MEVISFDFDGVIHISVTYPDINGQIHPIPEIRYKPEKWEPNKLIISLIKEYKKTKKLYIVTHRSKREKSCVIKFLKKYGLNSLIPNIRFAKGNKGQVLVKIKATTHYDDSINVLDDIHKYYPHIKLYRVFPHKNIVNEYISDMSITYKNAAIILFTGTKLDRVVLLRDKHTQEWMVPGGMVDNNDQTSFHTMKREFREETGFNLPYLSDQSSYNYNDSTIIYKAYTNTKFPKFKPTKEADKLHYAKLDDILNGKFEKKYGYLKHYVASSFKKMRQYKFL